MVPTTSNVLNGSVTSLISQIWTLLSFPPVAKYFPFGLIDTQLIFPVCGLKLYRMEKLVFQILILPSQPTLTKYGAKVLLVYAFNVGEYLMQLTQSVWLLDSLVNLQSANVFHNLIVLSAPAEIIYLLSGENCTVRTSLVCPTKILVVLAVLKSHNLNVLSQLLEIKN